MLRESQTNEVAPKFEVVLAWAREVSLVQADWREAAWAKLDCFALEDWRAAASEMLEDSPARVDCCAEPLAEADSHVEALRLAVEK